MDYSEYEKMYHLEKSYWWFQGRKHIVMGLIEPYLKAHPSACMIDLGCGTGLILDELNSRGQSVGIDVSPRALEFCRRRNLRDLIRADVVRLPLRSGCADVVTALDLAEHLDDDQALVAEIARILRPGGQVLFTVPAHAFLWSEHDETLWHKRRYSKRSFLALLRDKPLAIRKYSYAITFTFVPIVIFRLVRRLWPGRREKKTHLFVLPGWLNTALERLLALEARLLRWTNLPFGVSLVCLAERRASPSDT